MLLAIQGMYAVINNIVIACPEGTRIKDANRWGGRHESSRSSTPSFSE